MPNNVVFNYNPAELKTQIFGLNGSTVRAVTVDSNGFIQATVTGQVSIANTVTVTGEVSVANTVTVTGQVSVTGEVSVANTVTVTGQVSVTGEVSVANTVTVTGQVSVTGTVSAQVYPILTEVSYQDVLVTPNTTLSITIQDLSTIKEYSYYVRNNSTQPDVTVNVILQLSPTDDTAYFVSDATITGFVNTNSTIITSGKVMKHARLQIVNTDVTNTAQVQIAFIGQSA